MYTWDVAKLFIKMFGLRVKPSDIPYSKSLLFGASLVFLLTKSITYLWFINIVNHIDIHEVLVLSYAASILVAIVWLLVLFASLRTTLIYYNIATRFVQTATSIVVMDIFLTLFLLLWLWGLGFVHLPATSPTIGSIGIILGFVLMMYWQFMVYINILVNSMNITLIKAGVFTLFYMLLQHNLSEILLNVVITVK